MTNDLKPAVLCFALALPLFSVSIASAQQKKPAPSVPIPAPIPAEILSAKKVFIANAGGDESRNDEALYSGGPDRPYNEFYAALKSWGRYELVATPADAELVFEIQLTVLRLQRERVLSDDRPTSDSQFRLVIRDAKTLQILWGLTEHAQVAVLQSNRDKNFEQALAAMVAEVQRIANPPATDPAKN